MSSHSWLLCLTPPSSSHSFPIRQSLATMALRLQTSLKSCLHLLTSVTQSVTPPLAGEDTKPQGPWSRSPVCSVCRLQSELHPGGPPDPMESRILTVTPFLAFLSSTKRSPSPRPAWHHQHHMTLPQKPGTGNMESSVDLSVTRGRRGEF